MQFYIASRFDKRFFLRDEVRPFLHSIGHIVESSWIDIDGDGQVLPDDPQLCIGESIRDQSEILQCDALLTLTYPERRGAGHLVEFGMALAYGKLLLVAGPIKTVFHHCADIIRPTWEEMKVALLEV